MPFSLCPKDFECGANAFCVMRPSPKDPSKKVPQCVCQDGFYVSALRVVVLFCVNYRETSRKTSVMRFPTVRRTISVRRMRAA